ncbi:MAG: hypothetical protein IJP92_02695 [Lachnospiraceae bacterium]|nr:hypothetical protein [Lachnospiraceae bacterium]
MIDFYAEDAMEHAFPQDEISDYVWEKLIQESVEKKEEDEEHDGTME